MPSATSWQLALALPWLSGAALVCLPRRWDRAAPVVAALFSGAAALIITREVLSPGTPQPLLVVDAPIARALGLALLLRVDATSELFAAVTVWVYLLVTLYAAGYLEHELAHRGSPHTRRTFHALMAAFAGSMLMLVTSENLLWLYVSWELTSITSFLLIGYWSEDDDARRGAARALVLTFAGSLLLLAGLLILGHAAESFDLRHLAAGGIEAPALGLAAGLVVMGAAAKCAQLPFTSWLPGAMAAPTPVSAFLHSASLVAAGVFVLARFHPVLATTQEWRWCTSVVAGGTAIAAGLWALRQDRFKGLLAYSTVSQYALMLMGLAAPSPGGRAAALYAFVVHAGIKAGLFLVAGALTHQTGTKSFSGLAGASRPPRVLAVLAFVMCFALSGAPLAAAFYYKEELLHGASHDGMWPLVAAQLLAAVLTAAYATRFFVASFFCPFGDDRPAKKLPATMLVPMVALATFTLGCSAFPNWVSALIHRAARHDFHVRLKIDALTGASVAALGLGIAWALALHRGGRLQHLVQRLPEDLTLGGRRVLGWYRQLSRGLLRLHTGNLRGYLAVLFVSIILVFIGVFGRTIPPSWPDATGIDMTLVAALALSVLPPWVLIVSESYITMVLALNVTGYALAVVFLLLHAPNVAIAQVLVETLAPLIVVMALRQSQGFVPGQETTTLHPHREHWRAPLSLALGGVFGLVTFIARENVADDMVGDWYAEHSAEVAEANDIVAAILADFRALDTTVEALVFVVAMLGVIALTFKAERAS